MVAIEDRVHEIYVMCKEHGWKVVIGIEPDKPEDISDVHRLLGNKVENTKTGRYIVTVVNRFALKAVELRISNSQLNYS
ncbi:hypothetical protein D3C74_410150 [compost metagenome]